MPKKKPATDDTTFQTRVERYITRNNLQKWKAIGELFDSNGVFLHRVYTGTLDTMEAALEKATENAAAWEWSCREAYARKRDELALWAALKDQYEADRSKLTPEQWSLYDEGQKGIRLCTTAEISMLKEALEEMRRADNARMFSLPPIEAESTPSKTKRPVTFKTPPGVDWDSVRFQLMPTAQESIVILIKGQDSVKATRAEMGMEFYRGAVSNPTKEWNTLQKCIAAGSLTAPPIPKDAVTLKKHIDRLSKKLQECFPGLKEKKPFNPLNRTSREYTARFGVIPPDHVLSRELMEDEDDEDNVESVFKDAELKTRTRYGDSDDSD